MPYYTSKVNNKKQWYPRPLNKEENKWVSQYRGRSLVVLGTEQKRFCRTKTWEPLSETLERTEESLWDNMKLAIRIPEDLDNLDLSKTEKKQIAAERELLNRVFNMLKEKENILFERQLTKNYTLNASRQQANADDITYKLYELTLKCHEILYSEKNHEKIIKLCKDNADLLNLDLKHIPYINAKFQLDILRLDACTDYNSRSKYPCMESYLTILDDYIASLEYFLKSSWNIDYILKTCNRSSILQLYNDNNHASYFSFIKNLYICFVHALCLCSRYSKDLREQNIKDVKGIIDKLRNMIDWFNKKDLAFNHYFNQEQLCNIVKTLDISTEVIITSLNSNDEYQSRGCFNINTLFGDFLNKWKEYNSEQRIYLINMFFSIISQGGTFLSMSNLLTINEVIDILKTTIESDGGKYNCFLLMAVLIKSSTIINSANRGTITNEINKKIFYIIENFYDTQERKITKIINNEEYTNNQKLFKCTEKLSEYCQALRLLFTNQYICDEALTRPYKISIALLVHARKQMLKMLKDFTLTIPIDSTCKEFKAFQELIVVGYVLTVHNEITAYQDSEPSLDKRKQNLTCIINDMLDETSMLPYPEEAISLISNYYNENKKSKCFELEANVEQKILNLYQSIVHDYKDCSLLLLDISKYLSQTKDKHIAKKILHNCLNSHDLLDNIVYAEQVYNLYSELSLIFYNIGDIKNAFKYNEAAYQLNKKSQNIFVRSKFYEESLLTNIMIVHKLYIAEGRYNSKIFFEKHIIEIIDTIDEYYLYKSKRNDKSKKINKVMYTLFYMLTQEKLYDVWDKLYKKIPLTQRSMYYLCNKAYRYRSEFIHLVYSTNIDKFILREKQEVVIQNINNSIEELEQKLRENGPSYNLYNELGHCFKIVAAYYSDLDSNSHLSKIYKQKAKYNFDQSESLYRKIKETKYDDVHDYESLGAI